VGPTALAEKRKAARMGQTRLSQTGQCRAAANMWFLKNNSPHGRGQLREAAVPSEIRLLSGQNLVFLARPGQNVSVTGATAGMLKRGKSAALAQSCSTSPRFGQNACEDWRESSCGISARSFSLPSEALSCARAHSVCRRSFSLNATNRRETLPAQRCISTVMARHSARDFRRALTLDVKWCTAEGPSSEWPALGKRQ